jgi:Tol biopolymer transport system component
VALSAGARLGVYEVIAPLGAGGMGEVYRARDPRLGRDVAIKVLAATAAHDADQLRRFEQEARITSALNHPGIVTIHEIGQSEGRTFIVMEIVEGTALRGLLREGALPLRKTLDVAVGVADALAAAHEAGVVHRDLKPENVMVTRDGYAKVLDFGLAKLRPPSMPGSGAPEDSPTMSRLTSQGAVLGTVGYMSPEQARGRDVDFRSDQFSLGVVLYEMLSGRNPFGRGPAVEVLSAIVRDEPEPLERLGAPPPPPLRWIVERCLAKDAQDRYGVTRDLARDLRTLRDRLSEASGSTAPSSVAPPATRTSGIRAWLPWGVAATMAAAAGALWVAAFHRPGPRAPLYLDVAIPAGQQLRGGFPALALSPDGLQIAYAATEGDSQALYLRRLDNPRERLLPDSEDALSPAFSPDGLSIAFCAGGTLKTLDLESGASHSLFTFEKNAICQGLAWTDDGLIIFNTKVLSGPLYAIPSRGGEPRLFTSLARQEGYHIVPAALPRGRGLVFCVGRYVPGQKGPVVSIAVKPAAEAGHRVIIEDGTMPSYSRSGHLVFWRRGTLFAVPFDLATLGVGGPPVPVLEGVRGREIDAQYALSASGALVFMRGSGHSRFSGCGDLVWVDRRGVPTPLVEGRLVCTASLSPDGSRVAAEIADPETLRIAIFVHDLRTSGWLRLTGDETAYAPLFSADGASVFYATETVGKTQLVMRAADGSGSPRRLFESDGDLRPESYSARDNRLLFTENRAEKLPDRADLHWLALEGTPRATPFRSTPASEHGAAISPNGRWVAYLSYEEERGQRNQRLYVEPSDGSGGRWLVSGDWPYSPRWSRDGKELLFTTASGKLQSAPVSLDSRPAFGVVRTLFETTLPEEGNLLRSLSGPLGVSEDGRRLLMTRSTHSRPTPPPLNLSLVIDWTQELTRLSDRKRP